MIRFNYRKGLAFVEGNNRWELQRKLVTGDYQLLNTNGAIANFRNEEILAKWTKGDWLVDEESVNSVNEVLHYTVPADFKSLNEKEQKEVQKRKLYLDAVQAEQKPYNFQRWQKDIKKAALQSDDNQPPAANTVLSWYRRYRHTKSIYSLVPRHREKKRMSVDPRFNLFEQVVSDLYLNKQKVSKLNVVKKLNYLIQQHNAKNEKSPLKIPATSTVYRWLDTLEHDVLEAARLGAQTVRIKQRGSFEGIAVENVLERYEIDHTPLDVIVIDEQTNLPIGRPWLTLIIDYKSKMIAGIYIGFNHPSAHSVLMSLRQAVLPKQELLKKFKIDPQLRWPVFGIPERLVADNGMDLHSSGLMEACFELGVELMYVPAKTPFAKGTVERVFRTITKELIHTLPGSTFSNIFERADYESEKKAAIDLFTLHQILIKWVVEVYHNRPHKSLIGKSPLEVWIEKSQSISPELPIHPQALEVVTGIPATRSLFHYGLELDGLMYNTPQLQKLRITKEKTLKLNLKFYEDQIGFIHVQHPESGEYFRVDCVHQEFVDVHRETYRITRQHARKRYGERHSIPQLLQSFVEIQEMIAKSVKNKKMRNRKQAARLRMQDTNQAEVLGTVKGIQFSEMESGLLDDLPTIKTSPRGGE